MLNYEFPPLGGGAGNATYFLLKEFSKINYLEIDLITSSTSNYRREAFSKNITVHYLNIGKNNESLHYQSTKNLLIYSWKAYFYSKYLMKKEKYNLIHAFFGIPCGFIAYLLRLPYIVSLRGSDVPFYNPRFSLQDKLIFRYVSKFIWKNAKFVIANSNDLGNLAMKTNPLQKIRIIFNGVDTSLFKPDSKTKKDHVILFVGRLIKRKNVDILIKAFTKLPYHFKKTYKIWVVGEGPLKNELIKLAKIHKLENKIEFLGLKNRNQLIKIYQKAEIYVLFSSNEGMSNTLLEAIACGLPIICSRTGDADKLVHENGVIIENQKELSSALIKIIKNQVNQEKMGQCSRAIALKMSWCGISKKYLSLYKYNYD